MASNMNFGIFARDEASKIIDRVGQSFEDTGKKIERSVKDTSTHTKELGSGFDKAGEAADNFDTKSMGARDALTGLQDTSAGFASIAKGQTFPGLLLLGSGFSDLGSGLYNTVIPALKAAKLATIGQKIESVASTIAQKAAALASKAWAAAQWLLNAAMSANPIGLVVAAIVALVAIFAVAWAKSETFRKIVTGAFNAVKNAVVGAFNWVKSHWPLISGILTGGILPAINLIKNNFTAVKNWIVGRFNDVIGFFRGIPGKIAGIARGMWNSIKTALSTAFTGWKNIFTNVVNFVKGLPGKIATAARGMWHGVTDAFKSAINAIIDGWNAIQFKVPGFKVGPVHFGGFTLGLPDIPRLAGGGITTGPTLAVVGDNPGGREAIVPLPRGGGGPLAPQIVFNVGPGSKYLNALIEDLRGEIRKRGGNVQAVLGQ